MMSERRKIKENVNESKNTRLAIADEFAHYRFGRDALAHVSRYLMVVERIITAAKKKGKPLNWIDVGCGDIYLPRILAASFRVKKETVVAQYVGLDIDEKSLTNAGYSKPRCFPTELVRGDITAGAMTKFENKTFDVLTCLEVLEHIKPEFVPGALCEMKRVARQLYISTPNYDGGTGRIPEDHIKEWSTAELMKLMSEAGMVVKEKIGVFANLNKVEALAKKSASVAGIYNFLKEKLDKNFLSIVMARFVEQHAQNILYVCE